MSKQRPNLAEIAAAGSTRKPSQSESHPVAAARPSQEMEQGRANRSHTKTRSADTKQIADHFPTEVAWQLRELALEHRTTVQALLGEALNDLFQKHGKPKIVSWER